MTLSDTMMDVTEKFVNHSAPIHSQIPLLPLPNDEHPPSTKPRFSYDDALMWSYMPNTETVTWVGNEKEDGLLTLSEYRGIYIENLPKGTKKLLASWDDMLDPDGTSLRYNAYTISADLKYVMFETNIRRVGIVHISSIICVDV